MKPFLKRREFITIAGVLILLLVVGLVNSSFVSPYNLGRVANSAVILILLAAGSVSVIVTKNIDVSVGSILALSGIIGGLLLRQGLSTVVVILVVVVVGAMLGILNGLIVTFGHVPSIVATLGTMAAFRGVSFLITDGYSIEDIPPSFSKLGRDSFLGLPSMVWLALIAVLLLWYFMARTKPGRYIYATGGNAEGARLVGVNNDLSVITAYMISGLMSGLAACVFIAQIGSISNQAGQGIEMQAIAAAVIGGVALSGGVGTVVGALFGAIFITAATSAMSFLGVPGFWSNTVVGSILLVALCADAYVRSVMDKRKLAEKYRVVTAEVAHEGSER